MMSLEDMGAMVLKIILCILKPSSKISQCNKIICLKSFFSCWQRKMKLRSETNNYNTNTIFKHSIIRIIYYGSIILPL